MDESNYFMGWHNNKIDRKYKWYTQPDIYIFSHIFGWSNSTVNNPTLCLILIQDILHQLLH